MERQESCAPQSGEPEQHPALAHTATVRLEAHGPKAVYPQEVRLNFWEDGTVTREYLG